jgi:hypothetical protein
MSLGLVVVVVVWKRIAWRCEACSVDCCNDCRLQVDVQLPCGSDAAMAAVKDAIQNRMTVEKLLNAVAPMDDKRLQQQQHKKDTSTTNLAATTTTTTTSTTAIASDAKQIPMALTAASPLGTKTATTTTIAIESHLLERGIGTMKLEFIRPHVLVEHLPAETDPGIILLNRDSVRVRPGDSSCACNCILFAHCIATMLTQDINVVTIFNSTGEQAHLCCRHQEQP